MTGKEINFRPASFYLEITDMLAGEVEGIPKDGEAGLESNKTRGGCAEVGDAVKGAFGEIEDTAAMPTHLRISSLESNLISRLDDI